MNALHNQGIDRLTPGLAVEATAPDGIIEAVRIEGAESRTQELPPSGQVKAQLTIKTQRS